jgi:hypothetical protein
MMMAEVYYQRRIPFYSMRYFLAAADQPVKTTSPHLRRMQRWQGEVCLDWLSERRGWDQEPA